MVTRDGGIMRSSVNTTAILDMNDAIHLTARLVERSPAPYYLPFVQSNSERVLHGASTLNEKLSSQARTITRSDARSLTYTGHTTMNAATHDSPE